MWWSLARHWQNIYWLIRPKLDSFFQLLSWWNRAHTIRVVISLDYQIPYKYMLKYLSAPLHCVSVCVLHAAYVLVVRKHACVHAQGCYAPNNHLRADVRSRVVYLHSCPTVEIVSPWQVKYNPFHKKLSQNKHPYSWIKPLRKVLIPE